MSEQTETLQILQQVARGGVAPSDALLRLRPRHILLVSCNPGTLARDAAHLAGEYEPLAVRPVDLFPHTPHLESVSLWRRR